MDFFKEKWEWYSGLPGNSHSIMVTWKNVSCYRRRSDCHYSRNDCYNVLGQ